MNVKLSTILVGLIILILFLGGMNPSGCGGDMLQIASKPAARITVPAWSGTYGGLVFWFSVFALAIFFMAWASDRDRPRLDGLKPLAIIAMTVVFSAVIIWMLQEGSRVKKPLETPQGYTQKR